MKTVKELTEQMRELTLQEQHQLLQEHNQLLESLPREERMRFYNSMMDSLQDLKNESEKLNLQVERAYLESRIGWINESWVNKSDICKRLYGDADKKTVSYFTLQRQGKRPWKPEQLKRLDEIRNELLEKLKN
jgi:hypothetical protein